MTILRFLFISVFAVFLSISHVAASDYTAKRKSSERSPEKSTLKPEAQQKQSKEQPPCTNEDIAMIKTLEADIDSNVNEIRAFIDEVESKKRRVRKVDRKIEEAFNKMNTLKEVKETSDMRARYKRCNVRAKVPTPFWMPENTQSEK